MVSKKFPPYPVIDEKATGAHIRRLRHELGYTVADLQDYFGFSSPQSVYHWEVGASMPRLENFLALSTLLNTTINEIIIENKEIK